MAVIKEEFEKNNTELNLGLKEAVKVENPAKQVADSATSGVQTLRKNI